jgi:hypothetical protein
MADTSFARLGQQRKFGKVVCQHLPYQLKVVIENMLVCNRLRGRLHGAFSTPGLNSAL